MRTYDKHYVDGAWVSPIGTDTFEVINPTTGTVRARIRRGNAEDVDRAVSAARTAFTSFSQSSREERLTLLQRITDLLEKRSDEFASLTAEEMGAPVAQRVDINAALASFRQAITVLRDYEFEKNVDGYILRREPIGVCGIITAWNWPVQLLCTKVSAALAAGSVVVVKPAEFTTTSAYLFAEVLDEAGVPAGVFNLVPGSGSVVGSAISKHPEIDMISFTGSTRAGAIISGEAASTIKKLSLELGGKSPFIVTRNADLEGAARWNVKRGFSNTGQSCHAPTRTLVHRSQMADLVELMKKEVSAINVGDPSNLETTMGPVANRTQYEGVLDYIRIGIDEGLTLEAGGLEHPFENNDGYFVRPTIFSGVPPTSRLAQEEIFGPVLVVIPYDTDEEAIEIANGTPYGLGGYVSSADPAEGLEIARKIRSGRVFINGAAGTPAAPMGGYKQSGIGREMGVFGFEEYLEVKALFGAG